MLESLEYPNLLKEIILIKYENVNLIQSLLERVSFSYFKKVYSY